MTNIQCWTLAIAACFPFVPTSVQAAEEPKQSQVQADAGQRPSVKCMENSPERRGEEGCTILASRLLVGPMDMPLYWHIERFDSLEAANKAAGPNGVAAEAHGSVWLMTVEPRTESHRGGHHVDWIGPLELPKAGRYTMRVLSSLLMPGSTTPVHVHSGPEVLYVVAGEQAMDTPKFGYRLTTGKSFILPAATIHRGRVIGSVPRRALGLGLSDAAGPATHDLHDPPPLVSYE
jgi:quercetin dioxygenase-like cupin family protein